MEAVSITEVSLQKQTVQCYIGVTYETPRQVLEMAYILSLRSRQNMYGIPQATLSNAFSWSKMFEFRIKFHWILFLSVQVTIWQHVMAWCRPGNKQLSEPKMVSLPTHICRTRPQLVKQMYFLLMHRCTIHVARITSMSSMSMAMILLVKLLYSIQCRRWYAHTYLMLAYCMSDSRFATSQWETSLQSKAVSHWLGANLESALLLYTWKEEWIYCVLAFMRYK